MGTTEEQVERADGRVELTPGLDLEKSHLYNEDLAPTPLVKRTWSTYTYAALWISMAHCIPTYMLVQPVSYTHLTLPTSDLV